MHNLFTGHKAFLGFFYLDYAYNNAVVHVFIQVLKESACKDLSMPVIQNPLDNYSNKMKINPLPSGKPQYYVCYGVSKQEIEEMCGHNICTSILYD